MLLNGMDGTERSDIPGGDLYGAEKSRDGAVGVVLCAVLLYTIGSNSK